MNNSLYYDLVFVRCDIHEYITLNETEYICLSCGHVTLKSKTEQKQLEGIKERDEKIENGQEIIKRQQSKKVD